MDWWVHRIATSGHYAVSPREIEAWSMEQVLDAHMVLDHLELLEWKRNQPPEST